MWSEIFSDNGYNEEESDVLAEAAAKKMTPHPIKQFPQIIGNLASSVGLDSLIGAANTTIDLAQAGLANTPEERNAYLTDAFTQLKRDIKLISKAEDFGYSLEKGVMENVGGLSQGDATLAGIAKLKSEPTTLSSTLKRFFGQNLDANMEAKAYKFLNENTMDEDTPGWLKTVLFTAKDVYNSLDQDMLNVLPAGEIK